MVKIDSRFIQYSFHCLYVKKRHKIFNTIKRFFSYFFKKYVLNTHNPNGLIFFTSVLREDHFMFFNSIYNCCFEKKDMVLLKTKRGLNFRFLFLVFKHILKLKEFKRIKLLSNVHKSGYYLYKTKFYERLWIYFDYINSLYFDFYFSKLDFGACDGLVVLYDTCQPERNLVNIINNLNKPTITLCHGIFNPHLDFRQESFLNYWNCDASYALTWGQGTSALFKKYSINTKTIICGNPIIRSILCNGFNKTIGVVFSVGHLSYENQKMIEIVETFAKKHDYKIHIRLHPGDDVTKYNIDKSLCLFEKKLDCDDFIICHTSAMLYMYLSQGKRVFKFIGTSPTYLTDESISFNTLDELEQKFAKIQEINFKKISRFEIASIGDEAKKLYSDAFGKILKERGKNNE